MIEIVYVWPDGREEVRYRRPDEDCKEVREVEAIIERLGHLCPYYWREVP